MKKFAFALVALFSFSLISISGCGGHDQKVVQPPAEEDTGIPEGQQDDLDKGMEEQMNQQGN